MIAWLCLTFGVAVGSAVLPLISIEIFVIGLMTQQPNISCYLIGLAVALGQVLGKMLYFLAARGDLHLPAFLKREEKVAKPPTPFKAKWKARLEKIRDRCHRHPHWMFGTHAVSSVVGLPPFMFTTVLAGLAGMSITTFVATSSIGRFARFTVLAASPALMAGWIH